MNCWHYIQRAWNIILHHDQEQHCRLTSILSDVENFHTNSFNQLIKHGKLKKKNNWDMIKEECAQMLELNEEKLKEMRHCVRDIDKGVLLYIWDDIKIHNITNKGNIESLNIEIATEKEKQKERDMAMFELHKKMNVIYEMELVKNEDGGDYELIRGYDEYSYSPFMPSFPLEELQPIKETTKVKHFMTLEEFRTNFDGLLDYVAKFDVSGELEKSMLSKNECAICNSIPCDTYQELCDKNRKLLNLLNAKHITNNKLENVLNDDETLVAKSLLVFKEDQIIKMLSLQQQKALQWLDEGMNFFITRGAGCGKSYTVKEISQSMQIYKTIQITASTGKAAHLISGVTIHAFAGIETGVKSLDYYKRHMHPDIKKSWLETDVLIIYEISMVNAETFNLLHLIACEIKQCYDELFGGIQVIACGDFFQIPPVKGEFAFKSKIWQEYMTQVLVLTECFRQKEDAPFFGALNEIRFGQVSDQTIDYFMSRCFENDINYEGRWFYTKDVINNANIQYLFQIQAAVYLKINAVVMLVKNINVKEGLCNGSVSIVKLLENSAVWVSMNGKKVKIEFVKEDILDCSYAIVGSRLGLPLKLAFCFTVHKAQGSTMNKPVVNFKSKTYNNSLYYVTLSRVYNNNEFFIIPNDKSKLRQYIKKYNYIKKMKFEYQTEESKYSNNSIYTEHFFYIKYNHKDEDIVEETQLYSEIQSPD
ncbi:ATP-dependent DNA helicase PIF1-like [Hydra vulgaris]|uniref:ATP-dependent DNA helicase n=1 Tax=Hydra vulgaris TaxID=6087 RepID=A0ABM4DHZ3_HYDVU